MVGVLNNADRSALLSTPTVSLKHLCQDDPGALDAIDRATVGGHGTNQYTKGLESNNITLQDTPKPQTGTSNTYALRRLRKDRPDLHERVLAEEVSPHAAMVEAGFWAASSRRSA
jgi:hypothetical protein